VRAAGMEARTTIQSFEWRSIRRVREQAPGLETSCLTSEQPGDDTIQIGRPASPWLGGLDPAAHGNSVPRLVKAAGARVWSPNYLDVTKDRIAEAHALGLLVLVWTVNDPAEMVRIIELGVDGIISDRPDILRAVMVARGMKVPASTPVRP
jgi:glycerophosphoryl diester phosphodiesterase